MSEISEVCGGTDDAQPLVAGSLRGYRTWHLLRRRVHVAGEMLPLTSVTRRRVIWSRTLSAQCNPPDAAAATMGATPPRGEHRAPQTGCECGIYAWYLPNDTDMFNARVFGVIQASGRILMGDHGFRAERARIAAIVTRNRRVARACAAAGIAVYRRRRDLLRDYPPEDLSALLGTETPRRTHPPRPRPLDGFDRTLCFVVWGRSALIAFAAVVLPIALATVTAVVAELALMALIVTRLRQ
jgi:hypothetical protein